MLDTALLPQAVLPLRRDGAIGQRDPQLAVIPLLLHLVGEAHARLLLLQDDAKHFEGVSVSLSKWIRE